MTSEELLVQVAGPIFTYPLTEMQLFTYLEDNNRYPFKVVDADSGETIGHAEIYRHGENAGKFCRILVGDENHRGKGIGQEIISQLLTYSIDRLKMQEIELNVYDWNTSAIRCYEKVGFKLVPGKYTTIDVQDKTWKSLNMVWKG